MSASQQTDIINNITERNNQTISYIDDNFLNNDNSNYRIEYSRNR